MDMRLVIGRNFARLRKAKGLSQSELAQKINISRQYISAFERGLTNSRITTLKRLADSLDLDISGLLQFEN